VDLTPVQDDPCRGHECDHCATCRRGRCCRRDNPLYKLPDLGNWDGPIYGELGVLVDDGERVECHACGQWFKSLNSHIQRIHNLTDEEYRALFGLRAMTPLAGTGYRERTRIRTTPQLRRIRPAVSALTTMTPEQRSAQVKGRKQRLQSKLDPKVRETILRNGAKGRESMRQRIADGTYVPDYTQLRAQAKEAARRAHKKQRELREDPAYEQRFRQKVSDARVRNSEIPATGVIGKQGKGTCVICGDTFCAPPSELRRGRRATCGTDACRAAYKRRTMLEHNVAKRPDVRRKISAARTARAKPKTCACGCGETFLALRENGLHGLTYLPGHCPPSVNERVCAFVHQQTWPCSANEVATALGLAVPLVRNALAYLSRKELIARVGRGQYARKP
jgi:hypothetical protein